MLGGAHLKATRPPVCAGVESPCVHGVLLGTIPVSVTERAKVDMSVDKYWSLFVPAGVCR